VIRHQVLPRPWHQRAQPLISTSFVITTACVPSRQRFFSEYPIRPSASSDSGSAAPAAAHRHRSPPALHASEAVRQHPASQERLDLPQAEPRHRPFPRFHRAHERTPRRLHRAVQHRYLRLAPHAFAIATAHAGSAARTPAAMALQPRICPPATPPRPTATTPTRHLRYVAIAKKSWPDRPPVP
jgi:hypothetical protein